MPEPFVFVVPGQRFQLQTERLREAFRQILASPTQSLTVAQIFTFIQLTDANRALQDELIRRGAFVREQQNFRNRGRLIDAIAQDIGPDLPRLGLYIPRSLAVEATSDATVFRCTPIEDTTVLVIFDQPPLPDSGLRFILTAIEGRLEAWTYAFVDELDPERQVIIKVDLTLAVQARVVRAPDSRTGRRLTLARQQIALAAPLDFGGPCECKCCSGFEVAKPDCPPIDQLLSLNLAVFALRDQTEVLQGPIQTAIQRQINAMVALYAQQRVSIQIRGPLDILDPGFLVVDPGSCFRGQPSPDTVALFAAYAGQIQAGEVACFVVRQVIGLAGCASHPADQPGFVMDRTIGDPRDSVMGHELGHVLSLVHVPDRRNLMWGTDGNPIVDPPPDLYPDQISAIRCTPYTRPAAVA